MKTRRWVLDKNNERVYVGDRVRHLGRIWEIVSVNSLRWSTDEYLDLRDIINKKKLKEYVSSKDVESAERNEKLY